MPGMTNEIRKVLHDGGFTEARRGGSPWGFQATAGSTPGVARVRYVPETDGSKREATLKFGNEQVSQYVRALQSKGFRTFRINGVKEVDTLLVMRCLHREGATTGGATHE